MQKKIRTFVLSALGICGVAGLAYAAGLTTDYVYIKPGGGGTAPGNNTIAFENAGTIDFRAAGSVDSAADLTIDALDDLDMISAGRITMNTATGIQFWDAYLPSYATASPAAFTSVNVNAETYNEVDVTLPAGGGLVGISNPTNPHNGAQLVVRLKQGATASTIAWDTSFHFGPTYNNTVSAATKTDYFVFWYNSASTKWECVFASKNF